jgi:hypothetical protein
LILILFHFTGQRNCCFNFFPTPILTVFAMLFIRFFVGLFFIVAMIQLGKSVPPEQPRQPPQPGDQVTPVGSTPPLHRRLISLVRAFFWDPFVRVFHIEELAAAIDRLRHRLGHERSILPPLTRSAPLATSLDLQEPPPTQGFDGAIPRPSPPVRPVLEGENQIENVVVPDTHPSPPSHPPPPLSMPFLHEDSDQPAQPEVVEEPSHGE